MKLSSKTIVLTGAGSGMGRELTFQLLKKGANVAGVDIHATTLEETRQLAGVGGDRFRGFVLDIANQAKVDSFPQEVLSHFGSVDGIINNAGIIQPFTPVAELSYEVIHRVMHVNFYGTVYLTKAFLPLLLQRPEAHIVNISSMGGFIPFPGQTIYGASKAAVKLFTEGLYAELKDTPVRVTVVHPGAIATNITENSGLGKPRAEASAAQSSMTLPAPKAAEIILRAMEKDRYRVTVGRDAALLDMLYRLHPRLATNFIGKMMKKTLAGMK